MQKKLLVVMPESPFPPRKNGIALRYYPLLQRLSRSFQIDLAIFTEDASAVDIGELASAVKNVFPLRRNAGAPSIAHKLLAQVHRMLPFGVPFDHYYYGAPALVEQLRPILSTAYDTVLWVTQSHVLYECLPLLKHQRLVIDGVDSTSLHTARALAPLKGIDCLRVAKARRWEAAMVRRAAVTFFVSPVDLEEVRSFAGDARLELSPNGILIDDFVSDAAAVRSPSIGFLGNMSYRPNIDAAHSLINLLKCLREKIPDLSLYIIGRDPAPSLLEYATEPGVNITGTVENIWPYVNAVDLFVMPMAKGAGQQNKLLEVMYAGKPIIASSIANGGIMAANGEAIVIADDEQALERSILELLNDDKRRAQLAEAGARFVRQAYEWDKIAERFAAAINNN